MNKSITQIINDALANPEPKLNKPKYNIVDIATNNIGTTFTLSNEAIALVKSKIDPNIIIKNDYHYHKLPDHCKRDNPALLEIIRTLGLRANGLGSDIIIKTYHLPYDHTYTINKEFDKEMVIINKNV
jgi:hypothetical protein